MITPDTLADASQYVALQVGRDVYVKTGPHHFWLSLTDFTWHSSLSLGLVKLPKQFLTQPKGKP